MAFRAGDLEEGTGVLGRRVSIRLADGSDFVLTRKASERPKNGRGQSSVSNARVKTLNAIPGRRRDLRRVSERALQDFFGVEERAHARRRADGSYRADGRRRITAAANRAERRIFDEILASSRTAINDAVERELRAHIRRLQDRGIDTAGPSQARLVRNSVRRVFEENFPGTRANLTDRIRRNSRRVASLARSVIRASPQNREIVLRSLRNVAIKDPRNASYVRGGNHIANSERLQRTETSRAVRFSTLALASALKIDLVYWRLSAAHRWYGGNEVCEKLAVNTGPDVTSVLREAGINPSSVNLRGLYTRERFPEIPHANCMCQQEIFVG